MPQRPWYPQQHRQEVNACGSALQSIGADFSLHGQETLPFLMLCTELQTHADMRHITVHNTLMLLAGWQESHADVSCLASLLESHPGCLHN